MGWTEIRRADGPEGTVRLLRLRRILPPSGWARIEIPRRRWRLVREHGDSVEVLAETTHEDEAWQRYRQVSGDDR